MLNAADFGVPQLRRRAFFVGILNGAAVKLPTTNNKRTTVKQAIYDLPFIGSGEGENFYDYQSAPQSAYQELLRAASPGIYNHLATSHSKLALERLSMIPKGAGREVLPPEHRTKSIYSGTWTRLREDEFSRYHHYPFRYALIRPVYASDFKSLPNRPGSGSYSVV